METKNHGKEAEDLEKDAKFTIISMDSDEDKNKKKILDDAKEEITHLYKEFHEWVDENMNQAEINEKLDRLKQETNNLLNRTKQNINEFNEREEVISGKQKAKDLGTKVYGSINEGVNDLRKNETVSKVVDSVSDTIDNVVNDERVKEGVKKFKKGTLKIAESAFNGLKRVLDTDDDHKNDQKG